MAQDLAQNETVVLETISNESEQHSSNEKFDINNLEFFYEKNKKAISTPRILLA